GRGFDASSWLKTLLVSIGELRPRARLTQRVCAPPRRAEGGKNLPFLPPGAKPALSASASWIGFASEPAPPRVVRGRPERNEGASRDPGPRQLSSRTQSP